MIITQPHQDRSYENQSIYVTGSSFVRCSFHRCTLILKDLASIANFEDCRFESCVWHLQVTISDRRVWEHFLAHGAGLLTTALPPSEGSLTGRPDIGLPEGGDEAGAVRRG